QRRRRQGGARSMDDLGAPLADPGVRAPPTQDRNTPASNRRSARHRTIARTHRINKHQDSASHPHRVRLPRTPTTRPARDPRPRITPTPPPRPNMTHGNNRRAPYLPIGARLRAPDPALRVTSAWRLLQRTVHRAEARPMVDGMRAPSVWS